MAGGLVQMSKMGGREGVNFSETAALHGALPPLLFSFGMLLIALYGWRSNPNEQNGG